MLAGTIGAFINPFARQVFIDSDLTLSALQLNGVIIVDSSAGPVTITLPPAVSIRQGGYFQVLALDALVNPVTVVVQGADFYNDGEVAPLVLTEVAQFLTVFATNTENLWGIPLSDFADGAKVLDWKNSVIAGTLVALPANTLDGAANTLTADADGAFPPIDGVAIPVDESILVKNEGGGTSPSNGIYVLTDPGSAGSPWVLTRRNDADTDAEVTTGMAVPVSEGTQANTAWMLATNDPIDLNVTPLTFILFSGTPLCDALPVAILAGAVGAAGVVDEGSRCDHVHAVAVGSPVEISDTTNDPGDADTLIRSNHVHAHGDRGGGSLHALVGVAAGFMSPADKTKLDGIQPGAAAVCGSAPTGIIAGSTGSVGTDVDAARCDHSHAVAVATPVATGTANAPGAAGTLVRSDHVHETAVVVEDEGGGLGTFHTVNFIGGGVVAFPAGAGVTVSIPGPGNPAVKEVFFMATDYGAEHGDFRVRNVSGTAGFNFTFCIPDDFSALLALDLIAIPDGTRAAADIDLDSDYGNPGEQFDNHSEADTTITFALVEDEIAELDVSSVFSALSANDYCGLQVDNNISGPSFSVDYIGIRLRYTPV